MSAALLREHRRDQPQSPFHIGDDLLRAPRVLPALGDPAFAQQGERELEALPRRFVPAGVRGLLGHSNGSVDEAKGFGRVAAGFGRRLHGGCQI